MPEADALSKAIRIAHNDRDGHPLSPLREPPPTPAEALDIIEDSLKRYGFNWITGANARDTLRDHLSSRLRTRQNYSEIIPMPKITLPPDPEGRNDERAEWAALALGAFMDRTGADAEDAITDLLCDLAHYCDRNDLDFEAELRRAAMHYTEETDGEGTQLIYEPAVESPTDKAICGNCRGIYENESLLPIQDLEQRIAAGEEVPAGECPECGALCHLIKARKPMQPIHRLFASVPVPGPPCVKCDNPNMTLRGDTWDCPKCGDSYPHDPGP